MKRALSVACLLAAAPVSAQVAGIAPGTFGARVWRESVANVAALPTCNSAASGHLRYAVAEAGLYRCNGSAWVVAISGGGGGAVAPFDPLSLSGLRLWFRATNAADDSSGEMAAHGDTVRQVTDASGNRSPLAQGTAGVAPEMYGNATPSGRAALDFDERSPWMAAARGWSTMGTTTELMIVAVVRADLIARNSATSYANDALIVDSGTWFGLYLKDNATPKVVAYNWDTNEDQIETSFGALGTWHVVTWRHSGGTLGLAVDGGAEVTVASGATADFTGGLRFGMSATSFRGMIAEALVLSSIPSAEDLAALVAYLQDYYGI